MTLDEELEMLTKMRDYINVRIKQIKWAQKDKPELKESYLWVQTSCIAPYLQKFKGQDNGLTRLAEQSGVSYKTLANIRDGKSEWTREDTADKIMMALGLPHIHLEPVKIKRRVPEPPPTKFYED